MGRRAEAGRPLVPGTGEGVFCIKAREPARSSRAEPQETGVRCETAGGMVTAVSSMAWTSFRPGCLTGTSGVLQSDQRWARVPASHGLRVGPRMPARASRDSGCCLGVTGRPPASCLPPWARDLWLDLGPLFLPGGRLVGFARRVKRPSVLPGHGRRQHQSGPAPRCEAGGLPSGGGYPCPKLCQDVSAQKGNGRPPRQVRERRSHLPAPRPREWPSQSG